MKKGSLPPFPKKEVLFIILSFLITGVVAAFLVENVHTETVRVIRDILDFFVNFLFLRLFSEESVYLFVSGVLVVYLFRIFSLSLLNKNMITQKLERVLHWLFIVIVLSMFLYFVFVR